MSHPIISHHYSFFPEQERISRPLKEMRLFPRWIKQRLWLGVVILAAILLWRGIAFLVNL